MTYVLALSDLHVGSRFGIFPSGFVGTSGAEVRLNGGQQYLLECWEKMLAVLPQNIDLLLLVGDIIDGQNLKQYSRFLCEVDPHAQARAAARLLQPLLERSGEIILIRGSSYHVGSAAEWEEFLGEVIQARQGPDGRRTLPWLLCEVDGVLLDVAHRQSYSMRSRGWPLEREIGFALERMDRTPGAYCIIRGHTHNFHLLDTGDQIAVSLPSWKLQDEFAQTTISPNRTIPRHIGAVGLEISGGEINAHKYLFRHPEPTVISIAGGSAGGDSGSASARGQRRADDEGDRPTPGRVGDDGPATRARTRRKRQDHASP